MLIFVYPNQESKRSPFNKIPPWLTSNYDLCFFSFSHASYCNRDNTSPLFLFLFFFLRIQRIEWKRKKWVSKPETEEAQMGLKNYKLFSSRSPFLPIDDKFQTPFGLRTLYLLFPLHRMLFPQEATWLTTIIHADLWSNVPTLWHSQGSLIASHPWHPRSLSPAFFPLNSLHYDLPSYVFQYLLV